MDSTSKTPDDSIDLSEMLARLRRGVPASIGLALIGFTTGLLITLVLSLAGTAVTSERITFSFSGFERGTYPNGSKFQPDDLRSPDIVNEAIRRLDLGEDPKLASKLRGALGITGIVSPNIIKERDRLRAAGQNPPAYVPDEYEISLSLRRAFPIDTRQRELLLAELVNVYLEKFRRTYVQLPPEFGNAFNSLKNADFAEYEMVLTREMQSLASFLEQKINTDVNGQQRSSAIQANAAKRFRSPTNNLSFEDLLKETELFTQLRLNDVLGRIYIYGLSKDRKYALVKMDYHLRTLEDQEQRLKQEESVVTDLLARTQERAQNYVLATKSQPQQGNQPMLDQGFIDTLLANDAYNFLVRRALEAGLAVKRLQANKALLTERRQRIESFIKSEAGDQATAIASTQTSLSALESTYQELLSKVRVVLEDYARQEYADAIRVTMQATTSSLVKSILFGGIIGLVAGCLFGAGLSLLNFVPGIRRD